MLAVSSNISIRQDQIETVLALALQEVGFTANSAKQIADWDPYDQNASAKWFDAEYMFGVTDGFDVVIGKPAICRATEKRR